MRASALNGDWPCFSSWSAASRIFSGTVQSATVFTRAPHAANRVCSENPSVEIVARTRRGRQKERHRKYPEGRGDGPHNRYSRARRTGYYSTARTVADFIISPKRTVA